MRRRMWALLFVVMMVAMFNPVLCAWAQDAEPVLIVESATDASSEQTVQQENQTQPARQRSRLAGRSAKPKLAARSTNMVERTENIQRMPVQEHINAPKPEAENRTVELREGGDIITVAEAETRSIPKPMPEGIEIRTAEIEEEQAEENQSEEEDQIILVDVDEQPNEEAEGAATDAYALTGNEFAINVQQPTLAVRCADDMYTVDGDLVVTLAIRSNAGYAANLLVTPEMSDATLSAYARLGLYPADASRTMSIGAGEEVDVAFTFNRAEEVKLSLGEIEGMMQGDALYFPVDIEIIAA